MWKHLLIVFLSIVTIAIDPVQANDRDQLPKEVADAIDDAFDEQKWKETYHQIIQHVYTIGFDVHADQKDVYNKRFYESITGILPLYAQDIRIAGERGLDISPERLQQISTVQRRRLETHVVRPLMTDEQIAVERQYAKKYHDRTSQMVEEALHSSSSIAFQGFPEAFFEDMVTPAMAVPVLGWSFADDEAELKQLLKGSATEAALTAFAYSQIMTIARWYERKDIQTIGNLFHPRETIKSDEDLAKRIESAARLIRGQVNEDIFFVDREQTVVFLQLLFSSNPRQLVDQNINMVERSDSRVIRNALFIPEIANVNLDRMDNNEH